MADTTDQSTTERDLITDLGDLMVIWDRLSDRIDALLTERAELLAELKRIVALLPGPLWNDKGTLIWSLLDVESAQRVIEKAEGKP